MSLSLNQEGFSIEQGFNTCLLFYINLWPIIEPRINQLGEYDEKIHALFFVDICTGFECSGDWNVVIQRITKVSKEDQKKGLKLSETELLLCTVEFCKYYNEIFNGHLEFILNLVESMRNHPEEHPLHWALWKRALADSFKVKVVSEFDWSRGPYRKS